MELILGHIENMGLKTKKDIRLHSIFYIFFAFIRTYKLLCLYYIYSFIFNDTKVRYIQSLLNESDILFLTRFVVTGKWY